MVAVTLLGTENALMQNLLVTRPTGQVQIINKADEKMPLAGLYARRTLIYCKEHERDLNVWCGCVI